MECGSGGTEPKFHPQAIDPNLHGNNIGCIYSESYLVR
jgi:hypothetical protein